MFRKLLVLITALVLTITWEIGCYDLMAQPVLKSSSGSVSFFSHAPLEDIKAESRDFVSEIDFSTSSVNFIIPIKGFIFRKSLMQQHFNEQYLESDKYPKATFKGKFEKTINPETDLTVPMVVNVSGTITIKDVSRQLEEVVTLSPDGAEIAGSCNFNVSLVDFNIKIPKMFIKNIAETVEVKVDVRYRKLSR